MIEERCELEPVNDAVAVGVVHIFEVDDDVILGGHVVRDVVIDDETQESIEEGQIDFLVDLFEARLEQDHGLTVGGIPDTLEIVDALAPLVHEEWWGFRVSRLDPVREESAFVRFIPEILI